MTVKYVQLSEVKNQIQAILFAGGDPVERDRILLALNIDEDTLESLVKAINDDYQSGPFEILKLDDQYQMCVKAPYSPVIRDVLEQKRNTPLSQAAMEVLAIIAYNQPVTRAFVEQVRGIDSSGVISSLLQKGLVEEAGRLELPGRPIAYQTTANFLRCFGMDSLDMLPPLPGSDPAPLEESEQIEGQLGFSTVGEREQPH